MNYTDWLATIPAPIAADPLWQMTVYRQALFLGDISWYDACRLMKDSRTRSLSDQLYRAAGSISANIGEGYSRASHRDQARYYEYALGSARETRDWYFKARFVLGPAVADQRMAFLAHIIRQLMVMVPRHRGKRLQDESIPYAAASPEEREPFLETVPFGEDEGS